MFKHPSLYAIILTISQDLKRYVFGGLVKRPLEYQLGRLVNQWQISQPPHLRHLAIIRDTAMKRSVTHYVHYSYENFKSLVDSGRASWEAVETVPENKKGKSAAAALASKPDLDEYGFPKLQASLFQGQFNNATPSECALAINVKPLSLASFDSTLKKLHDGTYGMVEEVQNSGYFTKITLVARPRGRRGRPTQTGPKKSTPQRLSFKPRGRPRKVPRTGLPANVDSMTSKEMNEMARLQQAAVKYDVLKIEREIYRRISAGENQTIALDEVLREVADEHTQLGLPPSLAIEAVRVRFAMPGEEEDEPIPPKEVLREITGEVIVKPRKVPKNVRRPSGKKELQQSGYLPSVAAYSMSVISESPLASTSDLKSGPQKVLFQSRPPSESMASAHKIFTTAPIQPVLQPPRLIQSTMALQSRQEPTRGATKNIRKAPPNPIAIPGPTLPQNMPDELTESDFPSRKKRKRGISSKNSEDVANDFVPIFERDLKRKRSGVESLEPSTKASRQYLPSIVAHTQQFLLLEQPLSRSEVDRGLARGYFSKELNQVALQKPLINEAMPPNRTESEMRNYKKQLNDIERPEDGIFLGGRTTVYRKGGSGPRKSRLAIFKLRRLSEFMWYMKETSNPEQTLHTTLNVDPKTRPTLKSRAAATTSSSARPPPASQASSADAPAHCPKSKTKRKRRASSVDASVHPSLGSIATSKDKPDDPVPSRKARRTDSDSPSANANSFAPAGPLKETIPNLLKSLAKRRPVDLIEDFTPRTSLHSNEGAASNLTRFLSWNPDKSTNSQWSLSKSSTMDTAKSTSEDANDPQRKFTGRPEFTAIAPGSQNESGLSIDKTNFQNDPSKRPPLTGDHPADASLKGEVQTKKRSEAKPMAKLPLSGGSIGFLRRKIIMDIVQNCGGVFPSDRELVYPFIYAWQKDGKPGTPERNTVTAACKSLYASGKLRQLYFSFKDKKGLMVTKPMMTVPEISPTDPKVKLVQQKIIDLYPRAYIPDEAEISEDMRIKLSTNPVYGTNRTFPNLEIDHESRVQLHHKPQYVQRIESQMDPMSRTSNQRAYSEAEEVTEEPSPGFVGVNQAENPKFVRRPDLDPSPSLPERKVQRLASLKRPLSNTATKPYVGHYDNDSRLDTSRGFSLYTYQWRGQSPIPPASRAHCLGLSSETPRTQAISSKIPSDEHARPDPYPPQLGPTEMFEDDFSNLTEAATLPITRLSAEKHTKPYLPSIAAHTQPYIQPIRNYKMGRYLPSVAAHTQPVCKPVKLKRQNFKNSQELWTDEQLQPSRMNVKMLSSSPSVGSGFQYDLQSSVSMEVSRTKVAYALNTSTSLSIDPWYAHQQISTIMDPDHYFHRVTGTFSTMFKTVKKWNAKTQPVAQKETFKADQIYSNWGLSNQASEDWLSPQRTYSKTNFEIEIDTMLGWELETEGFERITTTDCFFINFTFQHPHILSSNARISMDRALDVSFSQIDGRILYKPFAPSVAHKAMVGQKIDEKVASKRTKKIAPFVPSESIGATTAVKRRRQKEPKAQFMSRPLTSLPEGQSYGRPKPSGKTSAAMDADGRNVKFRRVRGPKSLNGLGEEGEKRLIFATLVIRTLTGGVERHIDWVLVARLFAPKFDGKFIKARWNAVLNKWRFQYERLYPQFQDIFTQGYEDGLIPPIDYDDLGSYDWAWLVDWTMENIEAPTKALPDLPAERSRFEERFNVKEIYEHNLHIFYETDVAQPVPLRNNNLLKQSYVYSLQEKTASLPTQESKLFAVAKSWIRANIISPAASYKSDLAKDRLLTFKEDTIELALKELMECRVLSQQNKGRLIPGRNYNISHHVMDRLKKNLDLKYFHQAVAYKRQLDIDLEEKDAVDFDPIADDGVVLAVLNMQAHGRVQIKPKNPPMNKYGLTNGGYETRKMDKERLKFTCEIKPKDDYIPGNPLLPLPPPPSQNLGIPMSRIPLWYDIHDKPVFAVWDMVLAATMAILSMRPGIDAKEIEKSMKPALEVWELELVLEWMVAAKAAKKTKEGYATEEWWWMCIDHGEGGDAGFEAGDKNMNVEKV